MKNLCFLLFSFCFFTKAYSTIITSTAAGGNWNAGATWVGGVAPVAADTVVIANSATVTLTFGASCANLTVGQGVSGILQYPTGTTLTAVTVSGNVTIAAGGILRSSATNPASAVSHPLSVGGDFTNNGTFNAQASANSRIALSFTGAANNSLITSATSSTTFYTLTLTKGAGNRLDFNPGTSFLPATGFLVLTAASGTFHVTGTTAINHPFFNAAGYFVGANAAFWLDNANATVTAQAGIASITGKIQLTTGIMNVGTSNTNNISFSGSLATGGFIMDGNATLNVSGKMAFTGTCAFNQSSGTINLATVSPNNANITATFNALSTNTFTMSGGTIILHNQNTQGAATIDWNMGATIPANVNITGGTLQIGTASTPNSTFRIQAAAPSIVLDNSSGNNSNITQTAATTIFGNLTLNGTGTYNMGVFALNISGNAGNPGHLSVGDATFTTTATVATTAFTLSGSFGKQTITSNTAGNIIRVPSLVINNTSTAPNNIVNIGDATHGNTNLQLVGASTIAGGTLTLTAGIVNTNNLAGNLTGANSGLLTLGVATNTVAPLLAGAGIGTASYINGPFARTFLANRSASGTYDNTTLFPTGKGGIYLPLNLDPAVNSGGALVLQAEAFHTGAGTGMAGVTASSNYWAASATGGTPGNLNNIYMRQTDAVGATSVTGTDIILTSPSNGANSYSSILQSFTAVAGTPGTVSSNTATSAAGFTSNGFYAYGSGCAAALSGPTNVCIGAVSSLATINYTGSGTGTWSSSNSNATIDASGAVTGVSAGNTTISYTISSSDACNGQSIDRIITISNCSTGTPGGIANNIVGWWRGDDATNTTWNEHQFGSAANNLSGTASANPIAINFNPAANFNGTTNFYTAPAAEGWQGGATATTYFFVAKTATPASGRLIYARGTANGLTTSAHGGQSNTNGIFHSPLITGSPIFPIASGYTWGAAANTHLSRGGFSGGAGANYYSSANGNLEVSATPATPVIQDKVPFYVGRSIPGSPVYLNWSGDIAEVIAYNGKMAAGAGSEANRVESYLALKYGISLNQATPQDYTASDGVTKIWNAANAATFFNKSIFGLGKDNGSGLDQRISTSQSDPMLAVSTDADFATTNPGTHTNAFTDKQFLTYSHNANFSNTVWDLSYGQSPVDYPKTEKAWQLQNTGGVTATTYLQFTMPTPGFPAGSDNIFYLLTDPTGLGNYASATPVALTQPDPIGAPAVWVGTMANASFPQWYNIYFGHTYSYPSGKFHAFWGYHTVG